MDRKNKLRLIRFLHTLIWIFFNAVIFYMLYAVVVNKIDKWLWISYAIIILESVTLAMFGLYCPLTVWARKYSASEKANFDIYLPEWLAKHNKVIYSCIVGVITLILIYRILM